MTHSSRELEPLLIQAHRQCEELVYRLLHGKIPNEI